MGALTETVDFCVSNLYIRRARELFFHPWNLTRWWLYIFLEIFTSIGEDEPILTSIFFKCVGSTIN